MNMREGRLGKQKRKRKWAPGRSGFRDPARRSELYEVGSTRPLRRQRRKKKGKGEEKMPGHTDRKNKRRKFGVSYETAGVYEGAGRRVTVQERGLRF